MPAVSPRRKWPHLNDVPRMVTECLGVPETSIIMLGLPLHQFVLANRTISVLLKEDRVVAISCAYRGAQPAWAVMEAESQRFLPPAHARAKNAGPATSLVLPTAAGWIVADRQLSMDIVRAFISA